MRSIVETALCLGLVALALASCEPQEPDYQLDDTDAAPAGEGGSAAVGTSGMAGAARGVASAAGSNTIAGPGGTAGNVGSMQDDGGAQDAGRPELGDTTATAMFHESPAGTATFTQRGTDVAVAIRLTSCAEGLHPIFIYGGLACDNAVDQGSHWDGDRGNLADTAAGSVINCKADKTGSLDYTRAGSSDTSKWTVGDHDLKFDVTNRVLVVSAVGNESARQSCADFR